MSLTPERIAIAMALTDLATSDPSAAKALLTELTRLKGENERLREGLKPFAQAAESLDETARDTDHCWESPSALSLFAGDLRNARALLSGGSDA